MKRTFKMNPGYIYILQNPSFPEDLLKIGKTTRTPKERAEEVSKGTGIPTKFNVVFDIFTPDCDISEKEVHEKLKKYRVTTNREFFKLTIDVAKKTIIKIITKHIEDEIILLEKTTEKKILQFKDELENEFSQLKKELKNEIIEKKKYLETIKPAKQEKPPVKLVLNNKETLKPKMYSTEWYQLKHQCETVTFSHEDDDEEVYNYDTSTDGDEAQRVAEKVKEPNSIQRCIFDKVNEEEEYYKAIEEEIEKRKAAGVWMTKKKDPDELDEDELDEIRRKTEVRKATEKKIKEKEITKGRTWRILVWTILGLVGGVTLLISYINTNFPNLIGG